MGYDSNILLTLSPPPTHTHTQYRMWFTRLRSSIVVIQSYFRGWVARVELQRLKYIKAATWAAGIIRRWFYGWQVRKMVRTSQSIYM